MILPAVGALACTDMDQLEIPPEDPPPSSAAPVDATDLAPLRQPLLRQHPGARHSPGS